MNTDIEIIIFLLFIFIVFGSIVISIVAWVQILNNDFNGPKFLWILISSILILGPLLYLTQGKKLIIKKGFSKNMFEQKRSSKKQYYLKLIRGLDLKIKILFVISISLIVFGYFVRSFDIFFFWESKPIGYFLLLLSFSFILRNDFKIRKEKKLKTIWGQIGFWFILFILFMKILMIVAIPNSDAYIAAKYYINNSPELNEEMGSITGFTVLPEGSLQTSSNSDGSYGSATFSFIIKGTNKFTESTIFLEKQPNTNWTVIGVY